MQKLQFRFKSEYIKDNKDVTLTVSLSQARQQKSTDGYIKYMHIETSNIVLVHSLVKITSATAYSILQ